MAIQDVPPAAVAEPALSPPAQPGQARVLAALFASAFVLGTAELVVVGVLPLVARGLGTSESSAGLLVTAYALGIAIGGPLLSAATLSMPRRLVLRTSLATYLLGNVLAWVAPNLGVLIAARAVTGALHGLFIGTAMSVATSVVAPQRVGRAIAAVLGGVAAATAFGVPLGTLIGQHLGWRAAFGAVVVSGVVALAAVVMVVPAVSGAGAGGLRAQLRSTLSRPVVLVLLTALMLMGGQFIALTFLTPYLSGITGLGPTGITLVLMAYGIASAVGTLGGGQAADRRPGIALAVGTGLVIVSLGAMALIGSTVAALTCAIVVWGVAGWAVVPSLQRKTVALAGDGADFAATLPSSAITGGIAIGSVVGGAVLSASGARGPIVASVIACCLAVPLVWCAIRLRVPETR